MNLFCSFYWSEIAPELSGRVERLKGFFDYMEWDEYHRQLSWLLTEVDYWYLALGCVPFFSN